MAFGDRDSLIARFGNENSYLHGIDPDNIKRLGRQVDGLIKTYTSITPPDNTEEADETLNGIWCDIMIFKLIPFQDGISDEEKSWRKTLYTDAMQLLRDIQTGNVTKPNSSDDTTQAVNIIKIIGTKRLGANPL